MEQTQTSDEPPDLMVRSSKHILKFQTKKKTKILDQIFKDYEEDLYFYMNKILSEELKSQKLPSTKNIPVNKMIHSQWRKSCYQHASIQILKLKQNYWKYKQFRYKKCYKYFSKENRQKKFLSKKYSELNLKEKLKIPEFKTIQIAINAHEFNIKSSKYFNEFYKISTPYKKSETKYQTLNLPIKHHKHSNKYKDWDHKKTIFLYKDIQGRYWLKIIYEKEIFKKQSGSSLGIDIGYKKLITTSRKEFIGTKDLNSIYDKISRKKQGSRNFKQSLIHRNEYINHLVNKMDLKDINKIYVEDLKTIKHGKKCNNRYVRFAPRFVLNKLSRFSEENGILFQEVPAMFTSQKCSNCGAIHEESRNKELYSCIECKDVIDADVNAAINILHRGEDPGDQCDPSALQKVAKQSPWVLEFRKRLTTKNQIEKYIHLTDDEIKGFENTNFSVSITPHILSLIDKSDPNCPIRKQFIPTHHESNVCSTEMDDPCGEDKDSPVHGLVHRYPDRVLFLVSDICAAYCRHCTRSRMVGHNQIQFEKNFESGLEYIRSHPEIRDVLVSGGDPLLLADNKLEFILKSIREIPHVEMIRIGTRIPITIPSRITQKLCDMLEKYHPLFMSIHVNHEKELSEEVKVAINRLLKAGIPLGSQTVLLKGINDNVLTMKNLMHKLLKFRIRPYYLYQCDPVKGTAHFRTTIKSGIEIIKQLRGYTSGYAVPTYVVDAPGGGGKVPLETNNVLYHDENVVEVKNWANQVYTYPEKENIPIYSEFNPSIVRSV